MTDKILFVDDDASVLDGLRRLLHGTFNMDTAENPHQAIYKVCEQGPFAVVVSDMRMPIMDGVQFLSRVREEAPDTVRMVLTGQSEITQAIAAVNEGRVFRYLTKPVDKGTLTTALNAGLMQYRLVVAERDLLENTLSGCIETLVEVLGLVNPGAFSRAMRVRKYVRHVAERMKLPYAWQLEAAAMLSQLGCVTLDPELLDAMMAGKRLTPDEEKKVHAHPQLARDLLQRIPRMEGVGWIIAQQFESSPEFLTYAVRTEHGESLVAGAKILRSVLAFDTLVSRGLNRQEAVHQLSISRRFDAEILRELETVPQPTDTLYARECDVHQLACGMILNQEIRTKNNILVIAKGQEISFPLLARIRNLAESGVIQRKLLVLAPKVTDVIAPGKMREEVTRS